MKGGITTIDTVRWGLQWKAMASQLQEDTKTGETHVYIRQGQFDRRDKSRRSPKSMIHDYNN